MPSESAARQMAKHAEEMGFAAKVSLPEDVGSWETVCVMNMLPTHSEITSTEERLSELAKSLGGYADGWGCFAVR